MNAIRVGSLGAGVQSSTMIFLVNDGLIAPPDFWVFADTMAEPESVYRWLEYLKSICKQEIIITSKGDIVADSLSGGRFVSAPFYIRKSDEFNKAELDKWAKELSEFAASNGINTRDAKKAFRNKPKKIVMGRRQCTAEYKIKQIEKEVRERLGYIKGQRVKHKIEMLIGISTDEIQRVKDSRTKWIKNIYPLIELNYSRQDCYTYFDSRSAKRPPRSACWFCPFKTDAEWLHLKKNDPVEFQKAIDFDAKIRTLPGFKHQNYLHRKCVPLSEIQFNPKNDTIQMGFINECEGMCGI